MLKFPQFKDKKVLIFGLGLNDGGLGMVEFFVEQGSIVTVTDGKTEDQLESTLKKLEKYKDKITYHLGGHPESDFTDNDIIIRNPAIKPGNKYLQIAEDAGKQIEMEMSLFLRLAPCKVIGISGTRGKSTTTTLIYKMLYEEFGDKIILAGNIGKSAIRTLPNLTDKNIVVLELSSFQLDMMRTNKQSPHASLLTNIYVDHMNWHQDMEDYIDCKRTLFKFQGKDDIAIINIDDPRVSETENIIKNTGAEFITFSSKQSAKYQRIKNDIFETGNKLLSLDNMFISGDHNKQNALGAIAMTRQFGVSVKSILTVLSNFKGVAGREEIVRELNGVTYVNDTTATSLEAILVALKRFGPEYPHKIIMISGGVDKGLDYSILKPYWEKYIKALVLLDGTASEKMAEVMADSSISMHKFYNNFADAVLTASDLAKDGDLVILCPGGSSFNMFVNEFDRGRQFDTLVNNLK